MIKLKFGMPTLIENKNLEESISLCKELGFSFLELNMNLPFYQLEELERLSYFQKIAKNSGIYFTIHLDENLNIADFNHAVASAYMETVKRTIVVAKQLDIPIVNMHMNHGVHFTLPNKKILLFEKYQDLYIQAFYQFGAMCEQEIGNSKIKICIENTNGFQNYEKLVIEQLLLKDVFALTFDIGHCNSCGNIDEDFLLKHKEKLAHFHIHDSLGKKDHMVLGTGEIDLQERLQIAKDSQCRCVIETKTVEGLRKSVQWLRQKNYM